VLDENWLGDTFVDGDFRPIPLASGMCGLRVSQLPRYAGLVRAFGIRHRVGNIFIYLNLDSYLDLVFYLDLDLDLYLHFCDFELEHLSIVEVGGGPLLKTKTN
jgi:hypothetical protein